jgi:hypothetical protein
MSILRTNQITDTAGTGSPIIPGGILQVINEKQDVHTSTSSTSFADSNNILTIIPKSTSSKILLMASFTGQISGSRGRWTIHSSVNGTLHGAGESSLSALEQANVNIPVMMHIVDTPNTTSVVTYKIQFLNEGGSNTFIVSNVPTIFTAMEIGG